MDGISYNRKDASRITEDIGNAISEVNDYMVQEFSHLKHVFRDNWVGPDEVAFMNKYLDALRDVFNNIDTVGKAMSNFVIEVANTMVGFQNSISSELGGNSVSNVSENRYSVSAFRNLVTEVPNFSYEFEEGEQLGLVTANSESVLVDALDTYTTGVQNKIKESISAVEVGNAFVSSENANMGVQNFINNVAESMQNLTKIVDSFKNETIPELVAAFKNQSTTIAGDSETAATDINTQING